MDKKCTLCGADIPSCWTVCPDCLPKTNLRPIHKDSTNDIKKEKEIMPTKSLETRKTKQELLDEIAELKNQIKNMEKFETYKNMSDDMRLMYEAFKDSGFSDEQAFHLLTIAIQSAASMGGRR